MNCKEAKQFISPYMDGELSDVMTEELLFHLEECANCRQLYGEIAQISQLLSSAGQVITPAPEGFKDSVIQRISEKPGSRLATILARLSRRWKK